MEEDNKDIFTDTKFSEKEKPKVEEQSFKEGFSNLGKGLGHIIKGIWHIFSKQFKMNLLIFLLIIALVVAAFYFSGFKMEGQQVNETQELLTPLALTFPTGLDTSSIDTANIESVITNSCLTEDFQGLSLSCPEQDCPSCEESVCPECVCDGTADIVYFQCLDGIIKEEKKDCNRLPMGLTTEDYEVANGILLTLNKIEYNMTKIGDFDGFITLINLSVYNSAGYDIKPKVLVYLYDSWSEDEPYKKTINFEERIVHSDKDSNEGITWTEPSKINFKDQEKHMKIRLYDIAEDVDEVVVELIVELDLG